MYHYLDRADDIRNVCVYTYRNTKTVKGEATSLKESSSGGAWREERERDAVIILQAQQQQQQSP